MYTEKQLGETQRYTIKSKFERNEQFFNRHRPILLQDYDQDETSSVIWQVVIYRKNFQFACFFHP